VPVRRARPDDVDAITDVHVSSWQAAYAHVFGEERLAGIDAQRRRRLAERMVADPTCAVFVAEDEDGRIVGFASGGASRDPDAGAEIYSIYLRPGDWGGGSGPELLHAAVAGLREAGHRDAILWVLEDNPRARRFYEREGWRLDGGHKVEPYLGVDVAEVRYRLAL